MRVTDVTKQKTIQTNLQKTSKVLQDSQVNLSNGKKLNKPSDDPVGAALVQDFRTSINHSKSIESNIRSDMVWLNKTESAITQMSQAMMNIKELAMQGGNGSATPEERTAMAEELWLMTKDLVKLANSREGKLYLFSGTKTFTQPLSLNARILDADVFYAGTRLKSSAVINPVDQTKPLQGLTTGNIQIKVSNPNLPEPELEEGMPDPNLLSVDLDGTETTLEVLRKINEAAKAQENWSADNSHPGGYKVRMHADMGVDGHVYLDPSTDMKIEMLSDSTGFTNIMNFDAISGETTEEGEPLTSGALQSTISPDEFNASFKGWAKTPLNVKVVRGGGYGVARYVVSDDGGATWSQPQVLNRQNEIFNPEGKASEKVFLEFHTKGEAFFREGIEFRFEGNEFVEYQGNDQIKYVPIDNGIKVALNITASELFREDSSDPDSVNSFDVLNRLIEALYDDDQQSVLKSLHEIDLAHKQLLKWQGQVGATVVELEASKERLTDSMDFKAQEISEIEDLDLAEGAIELNKAELKNKVALDSAGRLIQPTLIDFLR